MDVEFGQEGPGLLSSTAWTNKHLDRTELGQDNKGPRNSITNMEPIIGLWRVHKLANLSLYSRHMQSQSN